MAYLVTDSTESPHSDKLITSHVAVALAKDGAELMIESGWLEKIPQTANRKELLN